MAITSDVLIPRIDTEVVAEEAIELVQGGEKPRVLDLCCGTGCIGLAIASNVPTARIVCVDSSGAALKVAKTNAIFNKLISRMSCVGCDVLDPPPPQLGTFELIVCNPPYIRTGDIAGLDKSVKEYEPLAALDGGEDGLVFYRRICSGWTSILKPEGYLVFECGIGQSEDVKRIGEKAGLTHIKSIKDTLDIERAIVFQI